jgi:16S rRNA processing protein RimM
MYIEDCFNLGYIAKLHGFKGEVSLFLDVTDAGNYTDLKLVYMELDSQLIPFVIENVKFMPKGLATIKLKGIDSEAKAKELVKKRAYLPLTMLPELGDTEFYDHEIINFSVIDKKEGKIGIVEQVIDLPSNPLLQILDGEKEVLVPLIPGLVTHVNRKEKILEIDTPEGLLELYR